MLSTLDIRKILKPRQNSTPTEDFRIIDSWAEYDESTKKSTHEKPLNYLCYELEAINPDTGEKMHFYKAIKFLRIIRLPKGAKQSTSLMDMHAEILAGTGENAINLVVLIANIIEPVPLGLLFLYGVQGVARSIDEAKVQAHHAYLGLVAMMQGTYRVLEMRCLQAQEAEWLREKMYCMEFLTVVRGIPQASHSGEAAGNKGLGGKSINPDHKGTMEDMIAGMADYEYVIQVLSTPVYTSTLQDWSLKTQRDMTDWYSQLQGTKSMSFNLSMPMMFMANQSSSEGWSRAFTDAESVSYSYGESFGTSTGQSLTNSISESFGQSFGRTVGTSVTDSIGTSQTISQGTNYGQSFGQNANVSTGQNFGQSTGQSIGQSISQSYGQTTGTTVGQSSGTSFTQGTNESFSQGQNVSHSQGSSWGQSVGQSQGQSYNISQGQNWGQSHTVGQSQGGSLSVSESVGRTTGTTVGQTATQSNSQSLSQGINNSVSAGVSTNQSTSLGESTGINSSVSASQGSSHGTSEGWSSSSNSGGSIAPFGLGGSWGSSSGSNSSVNSSVNESMSSSVGSNQGWNTGVSSGTGTNFGVSQGNSAGVSNTTGSSLSNSVSQSASQSHTSGVSSSQNWGTNESFGVSSGRSLSESWGVNQSTSQTQSIGQNVSDSWGLSSSHSQGTSQSHGVTQGISSSQSVSQSATQGLSDTTSQNWGQSYGISQGQSHGTSQGQNFGTSESLSLGNTQSRSIGQSQSESVTNSQTHGTSESQGQSWGQNQGHSNTVGQSSSQSLSNGASGAYMSGMASSMGLGPSIGYNKSYQWMDQQVKDIIELLEFQNERIKNALRGNGAFYTYVYIGCPNEDALSAAMSIAKSTWHNDEAMVNPLQVLKLSEEEQKHLHYHFCAFSSDVTRENVAGISEYKYCTVLLPSEFVAYTHLPRISEGGVFAEVADVPKFSVPSMLSGEVYMGTVLSPERYTMNNGYRTPYDYRIDENELMHAFFTGASRSGKTVAAMRFVAELSKVRRKKTGKKLRIVCMDPKNDWRTLARYVEPERFRFYSLGNMNFRPIKINPLKIPYGVTPQYWIDGIIDIYCRAYGLLERGKQMLGETIYALYEEAGVFDACEAEDWKSKVPELSRKVTFSEVYKRMSQIKARLDDPLNPKGRAGNDTRDAYARLLDRLQAFARDFSIEKRLFGTEEGIGVDELIGKDDVTVLESKGLETTFRNFIFGVITSGFYKYGIAHEGGYLSEDEYETVLIIEEASEILTGNDAAGTGSGRDFGMTGQSEFEQILDQSAGYGLFIVAITQKIADMPKSIIANSGLIFAGRLKTADDVKVVVRALAREDMFEDRDLVKFHPRMPTGWFVCQSSRTFDIKDSEPILVQISRLNIAPPSNAEIDAILSLRDAKCLVSAE